MARTPQQIEMRSKHFFLLLLVPLSEIKALFYNSNLRVRYSLFTDEKKYLCNVLEDYANIIILGTVFYLLVFCKIYKNTKLLSMLLFTLNALDLLHLGLMDVQFLAIPKLIFSFIIVKLWVSLKPL